MRFTVTAAVIFSLALFLPLNGAQGENSKEAIHAAKEKALVWLKKQKAPCEAVPDPQPERRNLVISYEMPADAPAYRYMFGRSIIYDDALAAIAFTMNRDYKNASQILLALKRLQRKDGGLWFGYNVNNDWPSENDYEGSTDRTGANAWVGYAAVFYLQTRLAEDPFFLKSGREAGLILELAQSLGDYLLKMQIGKSGDLRYGLITGGKNSYTLKLEKNAVSEIFSETSIDWISSEHNIDAYFFMRDLGTLAGSVKYSRSAELIKKSMMRVWNAKAKQYSRGIKPLFVDDALALDCASWGAVFSLSAGRADYAAASLEAADDLYLSAALTPKGKVIGYKPYAKKEIYEDGGSDIARLYFPDLKGTTWDDVHGVWVEGSMGVACARLKNGNRDKAEAILKNVLPLQGRSGGFVYFTRDIPHEFSAYQSVASTAWFVMVASMLEDPSAAAGFWRL